MLPSIESPPRSGARRPVQRSRSALVVILVLVTVGSLLLISALIRLDRVKKGNAIAFLGNIRKQDDKATRNDQQRCKGWVRRRRWDPLRILNAGSKKESMVHTGNLYRLREKIEEAIHQDRKLRIGILGGSFSAGGVTADYGDAYPEVLKALLQNTTLIPSGVDVVNMAQGGAGFMLPLYCTEKVYSMVANDPAVKPDVWIVEFAENFDSSVDQYEALLAMLKYDNARFGRPAVITAAVAKNFCWEKDGNIRRDQCGLFRTFEWLQDAATSLDLPLVSFLHGVSHSLGVDAGDLIKSDHPLVLDAKTEKRLEEFHAKLYADCGDNQHFNEYGHRLLGEYLYNVFVEAENITYPSVENSREPSLSAVLPHLPLGAAEMLSRVSSISPKQTLTCNLTLTQGRALDLAPIAAKNFTLWTEKVQAGNSIFNSRTRADRKQTWTPSKENATLDFSFMIRPAATTLCVLMYAANGMYLEASFPDTPYDLQPVYRYQTNMTEDCKQLNSDGTILHLDCSDKDVVDEIEIPTSCSLRGGVDWTIYSVYKITCDCRLPKPWSKTGGNHTIRFRSTVGLPQIAGVVIW